MPANADRAHRLSGLLADNAGTLLQRWVQLAGAELQGRLTVAELERDLRELLDTLLPVAGRQAADVRTGADFTELNTVLTELSRRRARQNLTPTETASSVFALKQAVFELTEQDDDPALFRELITFSSLLDSLGLLTFEAYTRAREEVINEQEVQLLELTTPVVKIWEGVLAVPLVGTLDSGRTQVVMEKLLQSLVDTGSEHAIIDITGVLAVDTQVAQHLLKTVVAARLMGAECTISGIRPQIAQTIVALGIEFGDITTKATLADALRHALRSDGLSVVRRDQVGA
ncbi:STAS domain-containing protein [Pseudonocardiaceae bacterium YIM PH 21723]|nr:STAS domain-containing protein [Pseudonocardiaceae bacterium YIM PH 21723]